MFRCFAKQQPLIFSHFAKSKLWGFDFLEFLLVYSSQRVIGLDKSELQLKEASQRCNIEYRWRPWKRHPCYVWQALFFPKTNCQDWVWRTLYWCKWVLRWSCHSLSGLKIIKTSNGRITVKVIKISKALHYMCPEALYTEAFRVLRPGGLLAIAGYHFSRSLCLFLCESTLLMVHFLILKFLFRPESPEFQEAFESVYEVRLIISLLKLGMPYSISMN